jgi:hypothetical protein
MDKEIVDQMEDYDEDMRNLPDDEDPKEEDWYFDAKKKNWRAIDKQIGAEAEIIERED